MSSPESGDADGDVFDNASPTRVATRHPRLSGRHHGQVLSTRKISKMEQLPNEVSETAEDPLPVADEVPSSYLKASPSTCLIQTSTS
jgi:hypothetical protein